MPSNAQRRRRPDGAAFENQFRCGFCSRSVEPPPSGSRHRNHCPFCLWSLHVDDEAGDRAAACRGLMEPVAVWVREKGEWALVHRCQRCGELKSNRIGADDNPIALLSIAVRPLAQPPFPLTVDSLTVTDSPRQ